MDLLLASFLDPRFKLDLLGPEYTEQFISDVLTIQQESIIKQTPDLFTNIEINEKSLVLKRIKPEEEESDFWREFDNSNMLGHNSNDEALIKQEIKSYLLESKISKEGDPSIYWSLNHNKYPRLSVLARKYLTALPTSAYSERCFSLSSNILTKKRSSLCPETAEILVFLNKNFGLCQVIK